MAHDTTKLALIVGASRGLGLALAREFLARGWGVIGTVRGPERTGLHATADASAGRLGVEQLDVTDEGGVRDLRERLCRRRIDLLFVNAGVANGPGDQVGLTSREEFVRVMVTNALAPLLVIEELGPLVRPDGQIAAMSSSLGSVSLNETGGWEVYRASKAALNTLMRSYAARHPDRNVALVDPGWVRTDMGGPDARLGIDESIPGVVDALAARAGKPGLSYFNFEGKTVPW